MSYLSYSTRVARFLTEKTGMPREKEEILAYAFEVLTLNLFNIGLTVLLGFLLGVLPGTLICLFTVAVIRLFAGGAHSDSPWRCAIITASLFPVMGLAASNLAPLGQFFADIVLVISILSGFITVTLLAPVDSPSAPVISPARRKRLKILSLGALVFISTLAVITRYTASGAAEKELCFSLGILWSSFILTPPGHHFFKIIDQINKSKKKEVL